MHFMHATSTWTIAKGTAEWSIVLSVAMILAGLVALVVPSAAGIAVTVVVGWLLIFSGIAHLIFGWEMRNAGAVVGELLVAVLYFLAGGYVLSNLTASLAVITVGLAIYLFLEAILEFLLAYRMRPLPGSGWLTFDGFVTILLAILMCGKWSSADAVGMVVGISMLFSGISRLQLSLAARRVVTRLP